MAFTPRHRSRLREVRASVSIQAKRTDLAKPWSVALKRADFRAHNAVAARTLREHLSPHLPTFQSNLPAPRRGLALKETRHHDCGLMDTCGGHTPQRSAGNLRR